MQLLRYIKKLPLKSACIMTKENITKVWIYIFTAFSLMRELRFLQILNFFQKYVCFETVFRNDLLKQIIFNLSIFFA